MIPEAQHDWTDELTHNELCKVAHELRAEVKQLKETIVFLIDTAERWKNQSVHPDCCRCSTCKLIEEAKDGRKK